MTSSSFLSKINEQSIQLDSAQRLVVEKLSSLQNQLVSTQNQPIKRFLKIRPKPVKGVYLWGGVGRGKTFMMDMFYETLAIEKKRRLHFHRFMLRVHQGLKEHQGKKDPLKWVAKELSSQFRVLCFDEFFVSDIADAMLLGTLFQYLFEEGICLIATSNVEPKNLYRNGLQRSKFLPAIALIEKHTEVVHIEAGEDYRLRTLSQAEIYHYPLDNQAQVNLETYFKALAPGLPYEKSSITIDDRMIKAEKLSDSVAWFSFEQLCMTARSSIDYIELAKTYHTILLSDVIVMKEAHEDAARRFIVMVDEFYERNVTLIISAQESLGKLYQGRHLTFEFERTISRLQEMQSNQYLSKPHLG